MKSVSKRKQFAPGAATGTGQQVVSNFKSNELFVALVGPAGAGAGTAAEILETYFEEEGYDAKIIKASDLIKSISEKHNLEVPVERTLKGVEIMQDRGDELREGVAFGFPEDHSAVARLVIHKIQLERARMQGKRYNSGDKVAPDGKSRAYIIDSLRHPSEAHLLRAVYQDAFTLIGVVCEPKTRKRRIIEKYFTKPNWKKKATDDEVEKFLDRDENAPTKFGQHVSDAFYQSDFFVNNSDEATESPAELENGGETVRVYEMNTPLRRFVSLVKHEKTKVIRPTIAETAMHQARSAQMRSACLSRQVGAALVDRNGNIIATGTNEVPRAGGGVYGEELDFDTTKDERCAFRATKFCSSNREQNEIIDELISKFPKLLEDTSKQALREAIRRTSIGGLIEFSRAVHAEMDAILSASIAGVSPKGCRLFVTTYPCHYCARHIVAAGIDEVQYIEPYPKSRAIKLHADSITNVSEGWIPPSLARAIHEKTNGENEPNEKSSGGDKILFRPFVGVAPRLYRRVFLKNSDYKDKLTGDMNIGSANWGSAQDILRISYVDLEAELGMEADS